jgi:hypothetical protein
MKMCREKINFLGHEIGEGNTYLQDHTVKQYASIISKLIAKRDLLEDESCLKILLSRMVIQ